MPGKLVLCHFLFYPRNVYAYHSTSCVCQPRRNYVLKSIKTEFGHFEGMIVWNCQSLQLQFLRVAPRPLLKAYLNKSCTHHSQTQVARALGLASQARAEVDNSQTRLCLKHKHNTEHLTKTFFFYLSLSCFVYHPQSIQALLGIMLTFVFVPLYRKQYVKIDMYSSTQAHFKMK